MTRSHAPRLADIIAEPGRHLAYGLNAVTFAERFLAFKPEPHQRPVLESNAIRDILCCSRQGQEHHHRNQGATPGTVPSRSSDRDLRANTAPVQ